MGFKGITSFRRIENIYYQSTGFLTSRIHQQFIIQTDASGYGMGSSPNSK